MSFKRGHSALAAAIFIAALYVPYIILELVDLGKNPNKSLELVLLLFAPPLILISILLFIAISYERTVEMSDEGCTVRFLRYEKFYRWDELQVKRLANYDECHWGKRSAGLIQYDEGAEFSPKPVKRRRSQPPQFYCQWHPLTYIYVNFRNKAAGEASKFSEHVCETDKESFLAQMAEWGVVLEEAPK